MFRQDVLLSQLALAPIAASSCAALLRKAGISSSFILLSKVDNLATIR